MLIIYQEYINRFSNIILSREIFKLPHIKLEFFICALNVWKIIKDFFYFHSFLRVLWNLILCNERRGTVIKKAIVNIIGGFEFPKKIYHRRTDDLVPCDIGEGSTVGSCGRHLSRKPENWFHKHRMPVHRGRSASVVFHDDLSIRRERGTAA